MCYLELTLDVSMKAINIMHGSLMDINWMNMMDSTLWTCSFYQTYILTKTFCTRKPIVNSIILSNYLLASIVLSLSYKSTLLERNEMCVIWN